MSHENNIIKAPVNILDDLGYVLGTNSPDVGTNCVSSAVKKYALYKPIKHTNIGYVTMAERIDVFHSLTPKKMDALLVGLSPASFSTVPNPEVWEYVKPSGGSYPYRVFDFLHIETDLTKISTHGGYNHGASLGPMVLKDDVTVNIATTPTGGTLLCPMFKYNELSVNQYGENNSIELYLRDLIFRKYGVRDNVTPWKTLPSSYDDIFNADGDLTTGVWRFALALAVKDSANTYKWRIVSSVEPLSVPFIDSDFGNTQYDKLINISANQAVANRIKYAVRNFDQQSIPCIPFLACNLQYNSDQNSGGWFFAGGSYDLAITFPDGDKFNIAPSGFATEIDIDYSSFRVAWTNDNDPAQNISGLTWYSATVDAHQYEPALRMTIKKPTGYSYCIMEFTFTMNTHFGSTSNMIAGYGVGSASNPGKLYTNDNVAIDNISGEWVNSPHTYKVRCMGPTFYSIINAAPIGNLSPFEDLFKVFFSNDQLAGVQNKLNAWGLITVQS